MIQLETICALATPQGIGAIGVIRVSGERTFEIVNQIFKGKDLTKVASHTIHFGTIRDQETIIDEVLVAVFKTPRSFTKEDVVEISCHGSDYIIKYILKLLLQKGCRMANPGEFTQRAFLNGQFDLVQAEAVADLIAADSEAAHSVALNQMRGGFSTQLKVLREELIHFASLIELELDFGEEDVEFAGREDLKRLILKIQGYLHALITSFDAGNVIKEGIPVAIIGAPNAGKSTLLNILLNEERAIVTAIAGTTRDVIEDVLFISGIKFRIIDTAGIRETKDVVESIGIERSKEAMQKAEIVLLIFDNEEDRVFLEGSFSDIIDKKAVIWVRNKIDLLGGSLGSTTSPPAPLLGGEGGNGQASALGVGAFKSAFTIVSSELLKKARELRRHDTDSEKLLWEVLRDRQLQNKKFRRQHPLEEGFILDFYCDECKLGIELDGKYHDGTLQKRYDAFRTREIEAIYKIKILRFTNEEIYNDLGGVLESIAGCFAIGSTTSPPAPLLEGEGSNSQASVYENGLVWDSEENTSPPAPLLGGEGGNDENSAYEIGLVRDREENTSPPAPLLGGEGGNDALGEVGLIDYINISARNNIGIEDLKKVIVSKSKLKKQGDTMLTNLRHYQHLVKAHDALGEVLQGIDIGITGDFLAQDIRLSLYHLGEITGQITSDDLLANIFSKFCIGK